MYAQRTDSTNKTKQQLQQKETVNTTHIRNAQQKNFKQNFHFMVIVHVFDVCD